MFSRTCFYEDSLVSGVAQPRVATQAPEPGVRCRVPSVGRRVGGRFWALADGSASEDKDDEDGAPIAGSPEVASPTPSDALCESLAVGYSEEVVADRVDAVVPMSDPAREGLRPEGRVEVLRRVVHRRTAPTAVRPWWGPLPKVRLPSLSLFFFEGYVSHLLLCLISSFRVRGRSSPDDGRRRGRRRQPTRSERSGRPG